MAVTASGGIFGFCPQITKESLPAVPVWYRHRASVMDLGVLDGQQVGPLEIGGGPFPTFPYKSGYAVGGGVTFQPRLENTVGWLLYAALGSKKSTVPVPGTNVHAEITETPGSLPQAVTTAITAPPSGGAYITVLIGATVGATFGGGTLTIVGTDNLDSALTRTFTLTGAATGAYIAPNEAETLFKTVTSLTVSTAGTPAADKFTVKYRVAWTHNFVPNTSDKSHVKWISASKYIPMKDADAGTDLYEVYSDCKPLSLMFTLPNDAPIGCRMDMLGRDFVLSEDAPLTFANQYEDWGSIPLGCETGGYIKFTGGGLSGVELPVVAAQVGWANAPLDLRQERVFGDPRLEDITIVQRTMSYDIMVKWNNPELYRAILTGSKTGLSWTSHALIGQVEALTMASEAFCGTQKYSLGFTSPECLWQMNGAPTLAAGQAIMMRFTAVALDSTAGDYTTLALTNAQSDYVWPVS